MKILFREPLFQFLLIGGALFAVYGFASRSGGGDPSDQIVVSAGRIEQIVTIFSKTWQRPPSAKELKGLIDDFVLEEVYYRQALTMGIDRDDTIIRRRLRQKLEFLTEDMASFVAPTKEELAAYLAENQEKFVQDPAYTFHQVYYNPKKYGDDPEVYIAEQLDVLRSGKAHAGDASLLPESLDQASRREVDSTFGAGFSRLLDELAMGQWEGPVVSGLGVHLILLEARTEGKLPELDEIRSVVQREWAHQRRTESRREMNEGLLENYEVMIEWPEAEFEGKP